MIVFVDEDYHALRAWMVELELRGHNVVAMRSARDAFQRLWNAGDDEIDLVLIDVMLDPGEELMPHADPLTTGLALLRDLSDQNPRLFPRRAVLFTSAVGETRRQAMTCATELAVEVWDKQTFASPLNFADEVERLIEKVARD